MSAMLNRISTNLQTYFHWLWQQLKTRAVFWQRLFTITILAAFLYIFLEWVYFVTMPSFMTLLSFPNKAAVFLISGLALALICMAIISAFILLDVIATALHFSKFTQYLAPLLPTIILSILAVLLIDNFTYTILKFGISTSTGILRGAYGLIFVILTVLIYLRLLYPLGMRGTAGPNRKNINRLSIISLGILALSIIVALVKLDYSNFSSATTSSDKAQVDKLPNIILLGSDGLNSNNLSVYGYSRDTTPRLAELAQSSLVAENAFTNSANTAGSVISILTSKLPTQTRVLYPPDILTGFNSYQHLPGMLDNLGYETKEYGVPYYIDAYNYNLLNGFDVVNNRSKNTGEFGLIDQKLGFTNASYFLYRLSLRITDRILHIFFIREMQNPFVFVTQAVPNDSDETKIDQAMNALDRAQAPIFLHIHLLGTHGGYYSPKIRYFSADFRQIKPWMTDFYDDSLLGFDAFAGRVIDHLKAIGQFDHTILIIYTDHNKEFKVNQRIPLIMHFPQGANAGEITRNVQNLDIAPTILDYLGIAQPAWMKGQTLLDNSAERRLIFSTGTTEIKPNEQEISFLDPELNKPPFYQFSFISVIDCQRMYTFDLTSYQWSSEDVSGYVNPCRIQDLLSMDAIKEAVYHRLAEDDFDISSLP